MSTSARLPRFCGCKASLGRMVENPEQAAYIVGECPVLTIEASNALQTGY